MMAAINPRIKASMIDGAAFKLKSQNVISWRYRTVYVNGEVFGQGRMSLTEILNKLDTGAAKKVAASLNDKAPFDVLVVGGGYSWRISCYLLGT